MIDNIGTPGRSSMTDLAFCAKILIHMIGIGRLVVIIGVAGGTCFSCTGMLENTGFPASSIMADAAIGQWVTALCMIWTGCLVIFGGVTLRRLTGSGSSRPLIIHMTKRTLIRYQLSMSTN